MNYVYFALGFLAACLVNWMIRTGRRESARQSAATSTRLVCPACAARLSDGGRCLNCGWQPTRPDQRQQLLRELRRLYQDKRINLVAYEQVVAALQQAQQSQSEQAPSPAESIETRSTRQPGQPDAGNVVVAEVVLSPEPQPTASAPPPVNETLQEVPLTPPAPSVQERAQAYAQSRSTASTAADPARPAMASPPRQPWSAWFGAFMEEKNIRWGELVGGLLILSGSVALVISFWESIAEQPLLKFGVLNGVTAGLFGLGLHASRRWRLPTTSQGILLTSTLLVPLNFLAIAAFSRSVNTLSLVSVAGEVVSTALLATLVYFAARVVTSPWPVSLTIGVIVPSVCQLLIRRHVDEFSTVAELYLFGLACLVPAIMAHFAVLRRLRGKRRIPERRANELIKHLGLIAFPALISLGLLLVQSGRVAQTLDWLAPLSSLAAMPSLTAGMLLWKRPGTDLVGLRLTGSSLTVAAVLILVAGCILAWPVPAPMMGLAFFSFVCLSFVAVYMRVPEAHPAAAAFLVPMIVLLAHVLGGTLDWTSSSPSLVLEVCVSAQTGRILAGVALAGGCAVGVLAWMRRQAAARGYAIISAAAVVLSLVLVSIFGFARPGDPEHFTLIVGTYTLATVIVAIVLRNPWAMTAGGAMLLATLVQAFNYGPLAFEFADPWRVALLSHSSIMWLVAIGLKTLEWRGSGRAVHSAAANWSLLTVAVAVLNVSYASGSALASGAGTSVAFDLFWMALIWLGLAVVHESSLLFTVFQITFTLGLLFQVAQRLPAYEWYQASEFGRLHPHAWQFRGLLLAVSAMIWIGMRIGLRRATQIPFLSPPWRERLLGWLSPPWISIDRWAVAFALGIVVLLTIYGIVPGIAQELTPRTTLERTVPDTVSYELWGIPHGPAHGPLTWILVGILSLAQLLAMVDQPRRWNLLALVTVASAVPLLCASHWASTVSVASATRWLCAIFFLAGSIVVWCRRPLLARLQGTGLIRTDVHEGLGRYSIALLVFFASVPLAAMAFFVSLAAVLIQPPNAEQMNWLIWLAVPCVLAIVTFAGSSFTKPERPEWRSGLGSLAVLATMPLFAMTLFVIGQALASHPIVGPDAASFFARAGLSVSYAVPLVVMSAALIGHAISFRSASIAFAAGLLLNFSGTAAYLLATKGVNMLEVDSWIRLGQLNALIASVFAIGWLQVLKHWLYRGAVVQDRGWLNAQLGVAMGFISIPILVLTAHLALFPDSSVPIHYVAGWWGWSALGLALASLATYGRYVGRTASTPGMLATCALGLCMFALQTHYLETGPRILSWLAFHVLQICTALLGLAAVGVDRWPIFAESAVSDEAGRGPRRLLYSVCIGWTISLLTLLGLRAIFGDPQLPWWSIFAFVAAAGLSAERGERTQRQPYLFVAAGLLNLATSLWWIERGRLLSRASDIGLAIDFLCTNVVALCLPILLWIWISRRAPDSPYPRVTSVAVSLALAVYALTVGIGLGADYLSIPIVIEPWTTGMALAALVAGSVVCLWQRKNQGALLGCYFTGFVATATLLDRFDLRAMQMTWISTLLLSAYALGTSYLWSRRQGLAEIARRLNIPHSDSGLRSQHWLVPLNGCLALAVIVLGIWVQFTCESPSVRLAASQAIAAQAFAMGLLSRGRRQTELRFASLSIGVVGAVAFGWSWIDPDGVSATWLNRLVVVASALMVMAVFYGIGLVRIVRRENEWTVAAQRLVPALVGLGTASVAAILVGEVWMFAEQGDAGMSLPAIAAVAVALVIAIIGSLIAAVVPGRDPFNLSDRQRTVYVYATEALVAILFLHIRVTMPELFRGFFQRYWTVIAMGIAFGGVGLSEWFRRRDQKILAEPLENTGVLLPLLPVIGFWVTESEVHYSLVMLMAGILYAGLSVMRRSFGFGILAALAANGGLWYFLHNSAEISFLVHPQLWLIPGAVCVLAAAFLNRDRLDASQMTTIRYLSMSVIYTSSTADVFINGVGESPWLPVILAGLSILGIFGGILLRIRSFLFLGTSFLLIALMTIIWHAAVDLQQTWLWYVTAILTGIVIIAVFAVFERKRQEVLQLMDSLKSWDS